MSMISGVVIGRLGQDPEVKTLNDGTPIVEFSIAVDSIKKDGDTTWVRASIFGERGTKIAPSYKKGDRFAASGRLELRNWESKDGKKGTSLEMRINDTDFIHDKREDAPSSASRPAQSNGNGGNAAPAARRRF